MGWWAGERILNVRHFAWFYVRWKCGCFLLFGVETKRIVHGDGMLCSVVGDVSTMPLLAIIKEEDDNGSFGCGLIRKRSVFGALSSKVKERKRADNVC